MLYNREQYPFHNHTACLTVFVLDMHVLVSRWYLSESLYILFCFYPLLSSSNASRSPNHPNFHTFYRRVSSFLILVIHYTSTTCPIVVNFCVELVSRPSNSPTTLGSPISNSVGLWHVWNGL